MVIRVCLSTYNHHVIFHVIIHVILVFIRIAYTRVRVRTLKYIMGLGWATRAFSFPHRRAVAWRHHPTSWIFYSFRYRGFSSSVAFPLFRPCLRTASPKPTDWEFAPYGLISTS